MVDACPYSGKTVSIVGGPYTGEEFDVEDYACNVFGTVAWELMTNNPAILDYLAGHGFELSNSEHSYCITAMYGHVGGFGKVIRLEEIEVPHE